MAIQIYHYVRPGSWCENLLEIDSAVMNLRMREKRVSVWIFCLLTYLYIYPVFRRGHSSWPHIYTYEIQLLSSKK